LLCYDRMKTQSDLVPSEITGGGMTVRVPSTREFSWFDGLLADHHYLGAGRPVGDYLRHVVEQDGKAVALLVWGPACYALKDRDRRISWSASQRLERLKLIVQNRRFLVLAKKGAWPNLASQSMGAALRALPEQWRELFGYRPLLAESFTDPEAYAGTCYKASNWEAVGWSAGYSRHRADFYVPNERPKRLWLRPLLPDALQRLRSGQLPEDCRAGLLSAPSGTLPVQAGQMGSLLDVFRQAPDPRDSNTRYRIGPVLTIIAMALLAGRREIAEIARFATSLKQPQRRRLLTLAQHEDGAPQAVAIYDQKEDTPRCEQTAAANLLEKLPALDGKMITADPLHCQRQHARSIVGKGGDYLLQIKGNQPKLLKLAQGLDALKGTPFLPGANPATGASRRATCAPSPSSHSKPTSPLPGR